LTKLGGNKVWPETHKLY